MSNIKKRARKLVAIYKSSKNKNESKVPIPFRSNYDYGEDGYNFIDKIRKRLKEKNLKEKSKKASE